KLQDLQMGPPWLGRVLLLLLQLSSCLLASSFCPNGCSCSAVTVVCTGLGLKRIPSGIPEDTTRLDLQENKISVIRKADFANLPSLKILQISDNEIHLIEAGSFDNLHSLERIRLNNNQLRELPLSLFHNNRLLYRIDLSHNQLSSISEDHLKGPRAVRVLQLDVNALKCFETSILNDWPNLEVLTLNNNNLTTIEEFDYVSSLRLLKLSENPWLCDCRLKWVKNLDETISKNVACYRPALLNGKTLDAVDESSIKCSGMEKRAASSCVNQGSCPASCTCVDSVVDCRDRDLTHIPAFLPASTTELRLEQNRISYIPENALSHMKNLRRLDMSKNAISEIAPGAFRGLDNLNTLVLYGNELVDIPLGSFDGIENLQLLLLNANKLKCIRHDAFRNLTKLALLSLYDNNIQSLSNETFHHLSSLQTLHLAKNPLICDCNLRWLAELLTTRMIETSGARCEAPKRVSKRRLSTLPSTKFNCRGSEMFMTRRADECIIDHECPSTCSCIGTSVDCSHRGLTEVPKNIPSFATDLRLNNNKISDLALLSNQSLHNVKMLDLSHNELAVIPFTVTAALPNVSTIHVDHNKIRRLSKLPLGVESKISVFLKGNPLECFPDSVIESLSNITLDLPTEVECSCSIKGLVKYAQIHKLPFPTCSSPPELAGARLIDITDEVMKCTGDDDCDQLNACPKQCLCDNNIVRCSNKGLSEFPHGIPAETTELFLDSNEISTIPIDKIKALPKLVKLDLSHNQITTVEDNTFVGLEKLSTLILSYNKVMCIAPFAFSSLRSLRILSLHGNDISTLPETAFTDLHNITHIALGSNSLHCDCELSWFAKWIKTRFIEAGIARCESPTLMRNQLLLSARDADLTCSGSKPLSVQSKCNACAESPCKNGASCSSLPGRQFTCECALGFHGKQCEKEIDACYGHPCMNNASCKVIEEGRFTCNCRKGFTGHLCEKNNDDCVNNKCQNGAKCIDMINSYRCDCGERFSGRYCEEKVAFCSRSLQPCKNGGSCLAENKGESYQCKCLAGFSGQNCTTNIDDCKKNVCQNGGVCIDGINSFSCECPPNFTGSSCEIPLMGYSIHQSAATCDKATCLNGMCIPSASGSSCKCNSGWTGDHCSVLRSIGFTGESSYASLDDWNPVHSQLNFTLTTQDKSGVLAYIGDDSSHLSVELFDGRIKISFHIGNPPASHLYSYSIVSDGVPHNISIYVMGEKLTLSVDNASTQHIENSGKSKQFHSTAKLPLFLGGVPSEIAERAMNNHQLRSNKTISGCLSDAFVDGSLIDFANIPMDSKIQRGCTGLVNFCMARGCGHGVCMANNAEPSGFTCRCTVGYTGSTCDRREIGCTKERWRRRIEHEGCISVDEVKSASCSGYCGEDSSTCCKAGKTKKRRVKMRCADGTQKVHTMEIVRRCECSTTCLAPSNPFLASF
ncbi:slt-1, partial [Pristionchus pacificus]